MKPRNRKLKETKTSKPGAVGVRQRDAASEKTLSDAFRAVEPPGFQDHPDSSIEAAIADPDVDDSEGGE